MSTSSVYQQTLQDRATQAFPSQQLLPPSLKSATDVEVTRLISPSGNLHPIIKKNANPSQQNLIVTFGTNNQMTMIDEDQLSENPRDKLSQYIEMDEHEKLEKMLEDIRGKNDITKQALDKDPLIDKYNTITFKVNQNKKKEKMFHQPLASTGGKFNSIYTDKEIFQKVHVVKNPHDFDSEEKIFNFKHSNTIQQPIRKHSQSPSLGGGFKVLKPRLTADQSTTTGRDAQTAMNSGNNQASSNNNIIRMSQTVTGGFWNSRNSPQGNQHLNMPPTAPTTGQGLHTRQSQFNPMRQASTAMDISTEKNIVNDRAATSKLLSQSNKNHSHSESKLPFHQTQSTGFMTNLLSIKKKQLEPQLAALKSPQLLQPIEHPPQKPAPLPFQEEQRLRKILRDCEKFDLQMQLSEEDMFVKFKKQVEFIKENGINGLKIVCNGVNTEIIGVFERGLNLMDKIFDQIQFQRKNEEAMIQIEREKFQNVLAEYKAKINSLEAQQVTEENIQRMFREAKKVADEKKLKIDHQINKLFKKDALACQTIEWPALLTMTIEEKENEDEMRGMNQRRMIWLENDLEMMTRQLMGDVAESIHTTLNGYVDILLDIQSQDLKVNVANGIQNQIAKFHNQIEDVLRENQRLLKQKLPEQHERYIQTEAWSMERFLEEIESLKRRRWIAEKENKEMKEMTTELREKIKRLKEDNRRFLKKTQEMRDKERVQDQQLSDVQTQVTQLKKDLEAKQRESDGKEVVRQKEIKLLKESIEKINNEKVQREVEIMKREEEMKKQIEFIMKKEHDGRVAVTYFQKQLAQKEEEFKNLEKTYLELKNRPAPVFNPALYKLQQQQLAQQMQDSETETESSLSSDEDSVPEIKADLNTAIKQQEKPGIQPIGKAKKGKKLPSKMSIPGQKPSPMIQKNTPQIPPSPSQGSVQSKKGENSSIQKSMQKEIEIIQQYDSQTGLNNNLPSLKQSDNRKLTEQSNSQHRISDASKSQARDVQAPITVYPSDSNLPAVIDQGSPPQMQTPKSAKINIVDENQLDSSTKKLQSPRSQQSEQKDMRSEQEKIEAQRLARKLSKKLSSKQTMMMLKSENKEEEELIDNFVLERQQDQAEPLQINLDKINNHLDEENDTIEPLQQSSTQKHSRSRKSRKSTLKRGSTKKKDSFGNTLAPQLMEGGVQSSFSRMRSPLLNDLNVDQDSPSQRVFPQYSRADLEKMLISYQANKTDYVEWKERKDRLITTEDVSIQCDADHETDMPHPPSRKSQSGRVTVSTFTQTTGQDIFEATKQSKFQNPAQQHPRLSKFEEFKKHVAVSNSQKSVIPRASSVNSQNLAVPLRREIVQVNSSSQVNNNAVNNSTENLQPVKQSPQPKQEGGGKKVQFSGTKTQQTGNKDLDQIHNNLDILHRLDQNLTALQKLDKRPSKSVGPRKSKSIKSVSPKPKTSDDNIQNQKHDQQQVEQQQQKKRNPFERTSIEEGAEESEPEEIPQQDVPQEKKVFMIEASSLVEKKLQNKIKKEVEKSVNQMATSGKMSKAEQAVEHMLHIKEAQETKDPERLKSVLEDGSSGQGLSQHQSPSKMNLIKKKNHDTPKIEHGHLVTGKETSSPQKQGAKETPNLELIGTKQKKRKTLVQGSKKKTKGVSGKDQEGGQDKATDEGGEGTEGNEEVKEDEAEDDEDKEHGWTSREPPQHLQDVNLMEYYEQMRPQKPFNAQVIGHQAPIYQIRTMVEEQVIPEPPPQPVDREIDDYNQDLEQYHQEDQQRNTFGQENHRYD